MPDPSTIGYAETGIIAAVFAFLGGVGVKAIDYIRTRSAVADEVLTRKDAQVIEGYTLTIARLDRQIASLESEVAIMREQHRKEMAEVREEHKECLRIQSELRIDIAALRAKFGESKNN